MSSRDPGGTSRGAARGIAAAVLVALALGAGSGCGFRPLYGSGAVVGDVPEQLNQTEIAVIPDRTGQLLRVYLIEQMNPAGRPASPRYRLQASVQESQLPLGIQRDDTATRYNLILTAPFSLIEAGSNEVLLARTVRVITGYDFLNDQFATLTAERDARERALRQISEDIRTRVALYFAGEAMTPGPAPAR